MLRKWTDNVVIYCFLLHPVNVTFWDKHASLVRNTYKSVMSYSRCPYGLYYKNYESVIYKN
jgi:hypothetical protein